MKVFYNGAELCLIGGWVSHMEAVEAVEMTLPGAVVDPALVTRVPTNPAELRKSKREDIAINAGDLQTLVGIISDGGAITLLAVAMLARVLKDNGSNQEQRDAGAEIFAPFADLLAKVEDGTVKFPHQIKPGGVGGVMEDLAASAEAVTGALLKA